MTKRMKDSSANIIELDKMKIDEQISSYGDFTSEGVKIKKWEISNEEDESKDKYIGILEKNGCKYSGTLNNKFQKDGYGLEVYDNGDRFFGQYDSDLRSGNGIYYFAPTQNNENSYNMQVECFMGHWKNDEKDKIGLYIWMDEPINNYEYDYANFDAYVGEFRDEKYLRGTYLSRKNNEYSLYHGNFDKEGKKNDNDAYFYTSRNNKVFHGKIKGDLLISGYLSSFDDEEGNVTDLIYCKFNEEGKINEILEEKQLSTLDIEEEKEKISKFRNVVFDGDHFGRIYNRYSKIKYKIDKLGDMIAILERAENVGEIDKILSKYANKNVYYSLEENLYGREI
jgi:hypothetical protein